MYKVGITGNIGSGKSIVANVFQLLGIPVFNADIAAKYLMENDQQLMDALKQSFGTDIYNKGRLNRPLLASMVFQNPAQLAILNSLVHPKVIAYGEAWHLAQKAPYTIKEAAIFFESGSYTTMDFIIGVSAPENLRLARAMKRDEANQQQILDRMNQQMEQSEKMKRCKYVIQNDDVHSVIEQVQFIHQQILSLSTSI